MDQQTGEQQGGRPEDSGPIPAGGGPAGGAGLPAGSGAQGRTAGRSRADSFVGSEFFDGFDAFGTQRAPEGEHAFVEETELGADDSNVFGAGPDTDDDSDLGGPGTAEAQGRDADGPGGGSAGGFGGGYAGGFGGSLLPGSRPAAAPGRLAPADRGAPAEQRHPWEPRPASEQRPALEPRPALAQRPALEPPAAAQFPALEQGPSLAQPQSPQQRPALEPRPPLVQRQPREQRADQEPRSGGRFEPSDSFDAFAAGAKSPSGGAAGPEPADPAPVPPAQPGPGRTLAIRPVGDAVPLQEGTSLFDGTMPLPKVTRPARDPLAPELGTTSGGNARVARVVTPDFLLTVNPVDGTEVVLCPPEEHRTPVRRTPEERTARITAGRPTPPPGPPAPELPLLERDEERERLIRLLARGRSIRVTGPSGAGRTALLESVANACADLAPDGVIWLSGYHRTAADLLHDLYTVVYGGEGYRPGHDELQDLLRQVGAVVVLDDLEIGDSALEELLDAAPECAFLMSATPDVPAPSAESMVVEVLLSGLTRVACVDLLQLVTGRRLEEDETAWAADLWFESEGLPLRFVQAGALLRQRDAMRLPPDPDLDDSVWVNGSPPPGPAGPSIPDLTGFDDPVTFADDGAEDPAAAPVVPQPLPLPLPVPGRLLASDVPLPSLAESAAPADLLASRLSEAAREALAFAVALDGECPHPAHLPALVGDTHGDAALGELISVGLAVPVASHFRLAAGVVQQLGPALAADGELNDVQAHTAALHYTWWTGHPSVTPERATAESEAILAAMTACRDGGHASAAVLLARTVAPVFAAALHWGAWERALRIGQEAARLSGEVAEEAYFHHELGVLALCTGGNERARAELEASIALRGALADRQGSVVGRRTLALVNDRAPSPSPLELPPGVSDSLRAFPDTEAVVIGKAGPSHATRPVRRGFLGSRRNLVAIGTGVVIAAVVGTIVTLGATSGGGDSPNQVKPIESVEQDAPTDDATTASSDADTTGAPPASATSPSAPSSATATSPGDGGTPSSPGAPATTPSDGMTSAPGVPDPGQTHTGGGNPTGHPHPPTSPTKTTPTTPPTTPPTTTPTSPTDTPTSPTESPSTGTDSQPATVIASTTDSDTPGVPPTV